MWGKFKTFFLVNLDIAATDRPKLPGCSKLPQMTVQEKKASQDFNAENLYHGVAAGTKRENILALM